MTQKFGRSSHLVQTDGEKIVNLNHLGTPDEECPTGHKI